MFGWQRREHLLWRIIVGLFVCLSLLPIWATRFPPMQDYPQHLFQAAVLSNYANPALNYSQYYECHLRPVYAAFFAITFLFGKILPIETAGKVCLSLYPLLVGFLVLRLGRQSRSGMAPWGAVLFFPLIFNQQYFLGNVNYLLSLPLLMLALLEFEDCIRKGPTTWTMLRQWLWQLLLFFTHPLTFLVYAAMSLAIALGTWRTSKDHRHKIIGTLGVTFLLIIASWIESRTNPASDVDNATGIVWCPLQVPIHYAMLMFTGMQSSIARGFITMALWIAIAALMIGALVMERRRRGKIPISRMHLILTLLACAGMLVLPITIGAATLVNLRIAAVVYFFCALLVAQIPLRGWWAIGLVALVCLCIIDSIRKQLKISSEIKEIVPIVLKIPPNCRILPLALDRRSPELDPFWFEPHLHDHNYYHVTVGGGFNPYTPNSSLNPVRIKKGAERPAPGESRAADFEWSAYAADYQYFLLRGGPPEAANYMASVCDPVGVSGSWTLFQRKEH